MNIRNVNKNLDEFKIILKEAGEKFDFIVMSETWTNRKEAYYQMKNIEGYNLEWSEKKHNKNGGIGIAIRTHWEYKIIKEPLYRLEADNIIIKLIGPNKKTAL